MYNYSKNELSTLRLYENFFSEPLKVLWKKCPVSRYYIF